MAGKGDKYRPVDGPTYRTRHKKIKWPSKEKQGLEVIKADQMLCSADLNKVTINCIAGKEDSNSHEFAFILEPRKDPFWDPWRREYSKLVRQKSWDLKELNERYIKEFNPPEKIISILDIWFEIHTYLNNHPNYETI